MSRISVLLLCVCLIAGCSLSNERKLANAENYAAGSSDTQEIDGVFVTLDDIVYTYHGRDGAITLYFVIDNQNDTAVTLAGSTNPQISEAIAMLKSGEQQYTMIGHGGSGFVTKRDGNDRVFEFPSKKQSRFHVIFNIGSAKNVELECYLPIVIDDEQMDFTFTLIQ